MSKPNKTQAEVAAFIAACNQHGFNYEVSNNVVRISKRFTPGDLAAFSDCDMIASRVLDLAPLRGGSVWGTDGGSVGGHVAVKNGHFVMNKSGSGARFLAALAAAKGN